MKKLTRNATVVSAHRQINRWETGKMTGLQERRQFFQDLVDTDLAFRLAEPIPMVANSFLHLGLIQPASK